MERYNIAKFAKHLIFKSLKFSKVFESIFQTIKMIKTVLLIDDDPAILMLNQLTIQNHAFCNEVIIAMNGIHGLKKIESLLEHKAKNHDCLPQLIFLDLEMPLMNGWEFLQQYKNYFYNCLPETKVVILSSSIQEHDHEKVKNFPFVTKMIDKPLLYNNLLKLKESGELKQYFA